MDYRIRRALATDAEVLAEMRLAQLLDEGNELLFDTRKDMIEYFQRHIEDGSYCAWIAEADGRPIATAAVQYQEYPPAIDWNGTRRGYVSAVYTVPECRHQGIAGTLLKKIVEDAQAKKLGCLWLMASPAGKKLYEDLGFAENFPGFDVYMERQISG